MAKFDTPSLSRGELAPGLQGRVDIAAYQIALAKCRNFVTRPTGGVVKRPGWRYRGKVSATRIIPFVYSTEIKYLVEAGEQYFRFWANGARVCGTPKAITGATQANPVVITSAAHGFTNGQLVQISGVRGMHHLNGNLYTVANAAANTYELQGVDGTGFDAYVGGGEAAVPVQVTTPYSADDLERVRFTQSADVLTLVHSDYQPRELRRLSATSFELREFGARRGPFRALNGDESIILAVSGLTGNVTVTANAATFTEGMVGSLIYFEEKELRSVKPWEPLERNVTVGTLRRSDGKVYRATATAGNPGGAGSPYYITGNTRPLHEIGRAWDGPGDTRNDGVQDYRVGVEWEYVHGGFGIVKITQFVSTTEVNGVVIERIPDSIKGTAAAPIATWTFSGDGATKVFSVVGATSPTQSDYRVTIDGSPVQPNPYYEPGTGGGGSGGGVNVGNPGGELNYLIP